MVSQMTRPEFNFEFKQVCEVFEKAPTDAYIDILANKMLDLTIPEFRAMKARVFEECEHFPKITKWVHLSNWIKDKRVARPINETFKNCEVCLSTGFIHVQLGQSKTFVKCICELSENWPIENMPTIEQVKNAKIIPWRLSDFKPSHERSFENLTEGFRETINIAQQFWAHNKGVICTA